MQELDSIAPLGPSRSSRLESDSGSSISSVGDVNGVEDVCVSILKIGANVDS